MKTECLIEEELVLVRITWKDKNIPLPQMGNDSFKKIIIFFFFCQILSIIWQS